MWDDQTILNVMHDDGTEKELLILEIAAEASDTSILAAISQTAEESGIDALATNLRALGQALLKRARGVPAGHLFRALIRSSCRERSDIPSLANATMASLGLWKHDEQPHPGIGLLTIQTKLYPDDFDSWLSIANLWFDGPAKLIDPAIVWPVIENALRLGPNAPDALYAAAMLHQHLGDERAAVSTYESVLAVDPEFTPAQFRLWSLTGARDLSPEAAAMPSVPDDVSELESPAGDHERAKRVFQKWGCVILRDAIPSGPLEPINAELTPWLKGRSGVPDAFPADFQAAPEEIRRQLIDLLQGPWIARDVVQNLGTWSGRGWEARPNGTWWLQHQEPHPRGSTALHLDYPVHADKSDWFTIWMPFMDCGPTTAPCLDLIPSKMQRPLLFQEHSDFSRYINPVSSDTAFRYFAPHRIRPDFQPGDLLVFSSCTIHGTFNDPSLAARRSSFDCRFQLGPALPV